jgi:hypothetical protein
LPTLRCDRIQDLTDPKFLSRVVGPVDSVTPTTLTTPGFSGSTLARLEVRLQTGETLPLVLKRTELAKDWTLYRSNDRIGREAMLLATAELAGVWDVFATPYVAFAIDSGAIGLMMHDLSEHLLPDVREPIGESVEDALISRLARLHARFWNSPTLASPWLSRPASLFSLIGPIVVGDDPGAPIPSPMRERVVEGWNEALRLVPPPVAAELRRSPAEHEAALAHLPRTLIHGDCKVANFGFLPGGRVAAFDWAMIGSAPASVELAWYLAVNASRLARPKEEVIALYRARLDEARSERVPDDEWSAMERSVWWSGALMLLWSKTLALREGRPGSQEEWNWWVDRLSASLSSVRE